MLHDPQRNSRAQDSADNDEIREAASESDTIHVAIPALDADEREMLREIARKIRCIETRNTEVERAFGEIAAAVESTADAVEAGEGSGAEMTPSKESGIP